MAGGYSNRSSGDGGAPAAPELPVGGPQTGAQGFQRGSPPPERLNFPPGDPDLETGGSVAPCTPPHLGFLLGDLLLKGELRGPRTPSLSPCLGFPLGNPEQEHGGSGAPRHPQPAHKLGGSAHVAGSSRGFRFCRRPTSPIRNFGRRRPLSPLSPKELRTMKGCKPESPRAKVTGDRSAHPALSTISVRPLHPMGRLQLFLC